MWCDAALSRTVRNIFTSLSQSVRRRPGLDGGFICKMMIDRWSEITVDRVCHEHELMRAADANESSDELVSVFGMIVVMISNVGIPLSDPLIESAILLPLEYHDE